MFPRKACVDANVYTDRWEFVLLLIPCFLLQEKQKQKENEFIFTMQKYEKSQEDLKKNIIDLKTDQVSYIFDDCTIQFTSPYRLACSSTGGRPDYLHVHKNNTSFTCNMQLQFCHHNMPPGLANHSPQHCQC